MSETLELVGEPSKASLSQRADDAFRSLWASLFYSGRLSGKTVLICSADRQEGASTVACGLALAGTMPAGVARVALVDFNLRAPSLHDRLGLNLSPGISEVILEGVAPESAAQPVNSALDVYTVGNVAGRMLEILQSAALRDLLAMLTAGYDHVLIDTAAVNHFPDAQVLASLARDVVLVAHTDQTPREAVAQAKKRLDAGGGKIAGLVLNMRSYPIPRFLYNRV